MNTIILYGGQMSGKTTLARTIQDGRSDVAVFDDVDKLSQIVNLASTGHRIPYTSEIYHLVIICTNLDLNGVVFENALKFELK